MSMQFLKEHRLKFLSVAVVLIVTISFLLLYQQDEKTKQTIERSPGVHWRLENNNAWVATGIPPTCPEPLVLATPVDLSKVTSILYPGQLRSNEFKAHGGFRFDNQSDNSVTVKVPFDAEVVRGSRIISQGETQYAFEFISPCGIFYWFGHLLELSPKFQSIIDNIPPNDERSSYATLTMPVSVKAGDIIATAVGFANNKNVFLDWGVLDLRQKNGGKLRPEWSQYSAGFDEYAVCWLDWLSAEEAEGARDLPGGDSVSGKLSDYCY